MVKKRTIYGGEPSAGGSKLDVINEVPNDKGIPHIQANDRAQTATFEMGRSLQSGYHKERTRPDSENVGYSFMKVEDVLGALPAKKLTAKEKKELEEKKKLAEADALEAAKLPKYTTKELAL